MRTVLKRLAIGGAVVVGVVVAGGGAYVAAQTSAFDASMDKVYAIPAPTVVRSTDPAVLARGKHLAESVAACAATQCHGADFGGGDPIDMGPVGLLSGPNVSTGGLGAAYSEGELVRLVKHGIKKDGRSLRFMPAADFCWLPDSDVAAIVSYLKSMPPVDRPNGPMQVKTLGKILDRKDLFVMDVARRIDHDRPLQAVPVAPSADYGRLLARLCSGCHGEHYSGGKIPGSPPAVPIPLNLTPHETGLKDWTYDDFARLLDTGIRKNGKKLDPFMPLQAVSKFDETERHALWAYLRTLPPTPLGDR
jgi:cytochrome c553